MSVALEVVVRELTDSGIIALGKLEAFVPPQAHPTSVEALVAELVKQNFLTEFQAERVAAGRAKSLIVGGYTLLDKIGAGGMGQVFKAQHRKMDRIVAIKMLPPDVTKDAASIARFDREVHAAAKLFHPNIVPALDAAEADGVHFLVMEYVAGHDLSVLVKTGGPLSVAKSVNYLSQAARGLEFAHGEGIVHRDIKPANLLLDKKDVVKILDMGLARIAAQGNAATQAELTGTGAVMGTVDYMSPEQAIDTHNADARSDIYSLGCTLHYLLTGRPLYAGNSLIEKALAHREQPIPKLQAARTDVPDEVEAVFRKLVAKQAADRYQTMTEVVAALEHCRTAIAAGAVAETDGVGLLNGALPKSGSDPTVDEVAASATVELSPPTRPVAAVDGSNGSAAGVVSASSSRKPRGRRRMLVVIAAGAVAAAVFAGVLRRPSSQSNDAAIIATATDSTLQPAPSVPAVSASAAPKQVPQSPVDRDREVAKWVISKGGFVHVAVEGLLSPPHREVARLPIEKFELRSIDLEGTGCTDADLTRLSGLPNLLRLNLQNNKITDDGVRALESLPKLSDLIIPYTKITATGFASIAKIKSLEVLLAAYNDGVTDDAIAKLSGLPLLHEVNVVSTPVTGAGLARLPPSVTFLQLSARQLLELGSTDRLTELCVYGLNDKCCEQLIRLKLKNLKSLLYAAENSAVQPDLGAFRAAYPQCSTWRLGDPQAMPPAADAALAPTKPLKQVEPSDSPKLIETYKDPAFIAWRSRVEQLPATVQLEEVLKKLVELNPGFDGKELPLTNIVNNRVEAFALSTDTVKDLSPVQALHALEKLYCRGTDPQGGVLSDLSPLAGMKLTTLMCYHNPVKDLSPLRGMPLSDLDVSSTNVESLSPLAGMPLRSLNCLATPVADLSPLADCATLQVLNVSSTKVAKLDPIGKSRLMNIFCSHTSVVDLKPLKGMPLKRVQCGHAPISDLTPLAESPSLNYLDVTSTKASPAEIAKLRKTLPECRIVWEGAPQQSSPVPASTRTK